MSSGPSSYQCIFCTADFVTKSSLNKHLGRCKQRKQYEFEGMIHDLQEKLRTSTSSGNELRIQVDQYESQMMIQQQQHEQEMSLQRLRYEQQLETQRELLKAQAEKIDKLENQIFEIARQPKQINTHHTTTTNNQRTVNIINQLAPYHLDTEEIQQILLERFTPEVFNGGPEKIAEVTAKFLLTDPETQKRRVVCTDSSRRVYRYIDPVSNELQLDPGFQKTHKIIKRPLEQANLNLFLEKYAKNDVDDEYRDVWKRNDEFIEDQHRFPDKLFQYLK